MVKNSFVRTPESNVERGYLRISEAESLIASYAKIEDTDLHILADVGVGGIGLELALRFRL